MGIQIIKMPDIGEGIAEVELVAWYVKVGDVVAEDQILADVMTDKATVEIPSSVSGKVLALGGTVGQVMAVGSEVIRIEVEGVGNVKDAPASALAATSAPLNTLAAVATPEHSSAQDEPKITQPERALPLAKAAPKTAATSTFAAPHARPSGDKPIASPAVRRRAWEQGIALQFVPGTGTAGRITQEDLDAYAANAALGPASAQVDQRYAQLEAEEAIPVIGLRRKIAQKMQDSKRRIPHFTYVEEVDVTELEDLRGRLNTKYGKERGRLTLLPFIARALVLAVRDFPQINARYDDEAAVVTRHAAVHLGIATQTAGGLMVPVLRHAETLDLWACAAEVLRLSEATRSGKAAREELSGSTITITSLGALGGIVSTPVINSPEVAIVGVNRMVERPMIRGGAVVARQMMNLSSSFDHRVVDGMHGAEFVQLLRGYLESPATLFVE
jgi:2-oxoisovalerate dehydrogenase E2 component (dihydrolipoyl transacylase)